MRDPFQYYTSRRDENQVRLGLISRRMGIIGFFRLIIFLVTAYLLYWSFGASIAFILIFLGGLAIFLLLVSRHADLRYERDKVRELIRINEVEIRALNRDFSELPTGVQFEDPTHFFSSDVDLFGRGSFFQYVNRTALAEGTGYLAQMFLSNNTEKILERQEAVKELAAMDDWRQDFTATANLVKTDESTAAILKWLEGYSPFTSRTGYWLPWAFGAISVGLVTALILDLIPWVVLLFWFLLGLTLSGIHLKKVNQLSSAVSKTQEIFHQYHRLLLLVENTPFSSQILKKYREKITARDRKASAVLRKFSKTIDALDQRNSMIFGLLINGFLLWDLMQSYRLERWISQHHSEVRDWFTSIEHLDAMNSLGNFAFNHPSYVFPELNRNTATTEAKGLGHPLLDPDKMARNDFRIEKEEFFIITGANMAGKSTFLITISLQIMMANSGLPVCADFCLYSPVKLITSMRTSDSLTDEESYFFSELKRLKFIVEEISQERYFIILDEILKGTNSTDKAIGSKKIVQRLVESRSTGIISTHDLSLCEVS